jgi:hypothetical protein
MIFSPDHTEHNRQYPQHHIIKSVSGYIEFNIPFPVEVKSPHTKNKYNYFVNKISFILNVEII